MPGNASLRVVVGQGQLLVGEGVVSVLSGAGFDIVGTSRDAPDLVRKARTHIPDVIVTDLEMSPGSSVDGLVAAREIRDTLPGVGVLVLSHHLERRNVRDLLGDRPEGVGFLLQDRVGDLPSFVDAVRRVAGGGCVLDPVVVAGLLGQTRPTSPIERLTRRERQVIELMADGLSNGAIARDLVVTIPAIERHITRIFDKLDLPISSDGHRRVLAVLAFLHR